MRTPVLSIAICTALALSACDADPVRTPAAKVAEESDGAGPAPRAAPLTASGAPVALAAADAEDGLQWAAGVVRVDQVPGESAKLFGLAGGDPAMNGLQTYIAFFQNPAEGWAVYQIGDFLDYTVLSQSNGRIDLDIHESDFDETTGQIGDRHRKIIVKWTQGANDAAPTAVTVTPGE